LKTVRKCQQNSSLKHLKNLKKIVRIALANDWIKKDSFYGIHFKHEETNIEFLTQEELKALTHRELSIKRMEQVRDVFVFCCFTGIEDKKRRKEKEGNRLIVRNECPFLFLSAE
jgi:hypothetical protein